MTETAIATRAGICNYSANKGVGSADDYADEVVESWRFTDSVGEILNTDRDLIFCESLDDLWFELGERFPAPEGLTRLHGAADNSYGSTNTIHVLDRPRLELKYGTKREDILAAAKTAPVGIYLISGFIQCIGSYIRSTLKFPDGLVLSPTTEGEAYVRASFDPTIVGKVKDPLVKKLRRYNVTPAHGAFECMGDLVQYLAQKVKHHIPAYFNYPHVYAMRTLGQRATQIMDLLEFYKLAPKLKFELRDSSEYVGLIRKVNEHAATIVRRRCSHQRAKEALVKFANQEVKALNRPDKKRKKNGRSNRTCTR